MNKVLFPNLKFKIRGFGRAWPKRKVTNLDLLKRSPDASQYSQGFFALMEKKILETFNVRERYMSHLPGEPFYPDAETSESLALAACEKAVGQNPIGELESFVLGSTTSRRYTGSQANSVLGKLGGVGPAYEIKAGCSTSLAALHLSFTLMQSGYQNALVTCAETLSKVADPNLREGWFGLADGGAALWLDQTKGDHGRFEVLRSFFSTEGSLVDLYTTAGDLPPRQEYIDSGAYFLSGDSGAMRKAAKEHYLKLIESVLPDLADRKAIRWIVPHQVSKALIEEVMLETGLQGELVWNGVEFGNIGSASVLFSLAYALENNIFKSGDQIFLMSVGGGLSYAAQLWKVL